MAGRMEATVLGNVAVQRLRGREIADVAEARRGCGAVNRPEEVRAAGYAAVANAL